MTGQTGKVVDFNLEGGLHVIRVDGDPDPRRIHLVLLGPKDEYAKGTKVRKVPDSDKWEVVQ